MLLQLKIMPYSSADSIYFLLQPHFQQYMEADV